MIDHIAILEMVYEYAPYDEGFPDMFINEDAQLEQLIAQMLGWA